MSEKTKKKSLQLSKQGGKIKPDRPDLPTHGSVVRDTHSKTLIQTTADTLANEILEAAERWDPSLIVIQGDLIGRVFKIGEGRVVIGRHPNSNIQISQRAVSSFHAELKRTGNTLVIEDLKSLNGTVVNKTRIAGPTLLKTGDLIRVGASVFKYVDSALDAEFSESIHNQMTRDALTGVFNRGYVTKALASLIEIAKTGYPLCLIMVDLDHFKKVNDSLGHLAGDYVLKETCRLLVESVFRVEDVVGRYGGEEFMILLPDCPPKIAEEVAERARKTIEEHAFNFEGKKISVTASLGIASWKPAYSKPDDFIAVVDELLYASKKTGRNKVTAL